MFKLPLFPLHTVLFPGIPISLHVFEERYKLMIARCVEEHRPFGVVLLKSGAEVLGAGANTPAEPYSIGCSAQITQLQPIGSGQMNLIAVGVERFQILSLDKQQPYLVGDVEHYPFQPSSDRLIQQAADALRPWVERYLGKLESLNHDTIAHDQLPLDNLAFAYLAAALSQAPLAQKQALLTARSSLEFIDRVRQLYRKETALLDALLTRPSTELEGSFSLN